MPKATKNAAKKRPVPTKRSPIVKAVDASAAPHSGREDNVKIMALNLAPGKLSAEMAAYFKKCDEKLGFVPNVLKAFAFDDAKLRAFVDYRQELVQNGASLSKLEIEMIATVVSSQNRCFYCITAHGNAVRQLGGPLGEPDVARSHLGSGALAVLGLAGLDEVLGGGELGARLVEVAGVGGEMIAGQAGVAAVTALGRG